MAIKVFRPSGLMNMIAPGLRDRHNAHGLGGRSCRVAREGVTRLMMVMVLNHKTRSLSLLRVAKSIAIHLHYGDCVLE